MVTTPPCPSTSRVDADRRWRRPPPVRRAARALPGGAIPIRSAASGRDSAMPTCCSCSSSRPTSPRLERGPQRSPSPAGARRCIWTRLEHAPPPCSTAAPLSGRGPAWSLMVRRLTRRPHLLPLLNAGRVVCERLAGGQVPVQGLWPGCSCLRRLEAALMDAALPSCAVEANDPEAMKATSPRFTTLARDPIALRHREPLDVSTDPTSAILAARIDGEPVPDAMAIGMVRQVLVVGIAAPLVMTGNICVQSGPAPRAARAAQGGARTRAPPLSKSSAPLHTLTAALRARPIGTSRSAAGPSALAGAHRPVYASANRDEVAVSRTPTPSSSTAPTSRTTSPRPWRAPLRRCGPGAPADARAAEELLSATSRVEPAALAGDDVTPS